jgi:cell division protein FtsW
MTQIANAPLVAPQVTPILPKWWHSVDRAVLGAVLLLMAGGVLLSFASSPHLAARNSVDPFYYAYRHMIFVGIAAAVMIVVSMLSVQTIRRLAMVGFVAALVGVFATLYFGEAFESGARRWLRIGGFTVQPSEFLKPSFMIAAGWFIAASRRVNGPPGILISLVSLGIILILLRFQPDIGQSVLMLFGFAVMLWVVGVPAVYFIGLTGLLAVGGYVVYNTLDYIRRRVDVFLEGDPDPTSQIGMVQTAIEAGGFWGRGLGAGTVHERLPDVHTDFVIAIPAEEFGVLFVFMVIAVYVFIFLHVLQRALHIQDVFQRVATSGLIFVFTAQAFINLGVAAQFLPSKGMTLPFLSNGGSSMVALGITMGAILAFTRRDPVPQGRGLEGRV